MLVDGLEMVPSSTTKYTSIETVTTLPVTNLFEGREVQLTAQEGSNKPGPYTYTQNSWLYNAKSVYDVGLSSTGTLTANQVVLKFNAVRAFTLPQNLAGSIATAETAPASATTLTISKNGNSIGSINFAAGVRTGTFTFAASTSFVAADVLAITAQATADTTFAGLAFTLAGLLD